MLVTDSKTASVDFEKTCDTIIQNYEPMVVTRLEGENVVIIPQAEYDNMLENIYLRKSHANYCRILESMEQARSGKLIVPDLEDLND